MGFRNVKQGDPKSDVRDPSLLFSGPNGRVPMEVPQLTDQYSFHQTSHPLLSGPSCTIRVDSPASLSQAPAVSGNVFPVVWAGIPES